MPELKLKHSDADPLTIAFPALAEMQSIGDGEPAYGAKFVIEPGGANAKALDAAMLQAAKDKWEKDGEKIFNMLVDDGKVCYLKKPYMNKKKGEPYEGFEGKHQLSTRNAKLQPTVLDKYGKAVTDKKDIERLIYSGSGNHISIEIWAQDNSFGRRINASLRGVMFAADGKRFGGGATSASADEFADLAADPSDAIDDLV
jgi:hypothetical protein